jgi:hypothetical protein
VDKYFTHPSNNLDATAGETNILPIFSTSSDVRTDFGDPSSFQTSDVDDFRVLITELNTQPNDKAELLSSWFVLGLEETSPGPPGTPT